LADESVAINNAAVIAPIVKIANSGLNLFNFCVVVIRAAFINQLNELLN
jgi:hypothetical protein